MDNNFGDNELDQFGEAFVSFCTNGFFDSIPSNNTQIFELANAWVRRRLVIINLDDHSTASNREQLENLNLSKNFINLVTDKIFVSNEAWDGLWPFLRPEIAEETGRSEIPRVRDCIALTRLRAKPIMCPFTGEFDTVDRCVNINAFLHSKNGRSCIIMSEFVPDRPSSDRVWFFPAENKLVVARPLHERLDLLDSISAMVRRIIKYREELGLYLTNRDPKKIMICEDSMPHIGHYIWNIISGWTNFFEKADTQAIDFISTYEGWQIFGGVSRLYADKIPETTCILIPESEEHRFQLMLANNAIAIILQGKRVSEDLSTRVTEYCRSRVDHRFTTDLLSFKANHSPIIMLTVRMGNRSWIEQVEGFFNIMVGLRQLFPEVGFVVDGLNSGLEFTHIQMDIESERKIFASIIESLPNISVVSSIGCSYEESIVWCSNIDFFIAPIGAGLAKTRWIANKPGLVFSNENFLHPSSLGGRLYSHWRDNPTNLYYIDRNFVSNKDEGHLGERTRANFSLDWRVILDAAVRHIGSLKCHQ